jgi:hypothetical protein
MPDGRLLAMGRGYSVKAPEVVTLATFMSLFAVSVIQRFPSGPVAMSRGLLKGVGTSYSVTAPSVLILATLFAVHSVNQRFPSGPTHDRLRLTVGGRNGVLGQVSDHASGAAARNSQRCERQHQHGGCNHHASEASDSSTRHSTL